MQDLAETCGQLWRLRLQNLLTSDSLPQILELHLHQVIEAHAVTLTL